MSYKTAAWHLVFWVSMLVLSLFLAQAIFPTHLALRIGYTRVGLLALLSYWHAWVLLPRLLRRKRWLLYGLSLIATLALTILALRQLIIWGKFWPPPGSMSPLFPRRMRVGPPAGPYIFQGVFLTTFALLISTAYASVRGRIERDRQHMRLEQEKASYELNYLRSQINPHFIFNTLNNLQAICILRPGQVEPFVQRLSDMLRYVLEGSRRPGVPLREEIIYLEHYIFFQQSKEETPLPVTLSIEGESQQTVVLEPMLLIVLVENAFQHSYTRDQSRRFIDIRLEQKSDCIHFSVRNNLPQTGPRLISAVSRHHGIGLTNMQRRLELLYPDRHILEFGPEGDIYLAELTLYL